MSLSSRTFAWFSAALVALALVASALAEGLPPERAAEREALLTQLADARSEPESAAAVDALWRFWTIGPTDEATVALAGAMIGFRHGDRVAARRALDALIERFPEWAEPWNQRATLSFVEGALDASLADCDRVLALEPAHFGALSGKAMILRRLGRPAEAEATLRRLLEVHPWSGERRLLPAPSGVPI